MERSPEITGKKVTEAEGSTYIFTFTIVTPAGVPSSVAVKVKTLLPVLAILETTIICGVTVLPGVLLNTVISCIPLELIVTVVICPFSGEKKSGFRIKVSPIPHILMVSQLLIPLTIGAILGPEQSL